MESTWSELSSITTGSSPALLGDESGASFAGELSLDVAAASCGLGDRGDVGLIKIRNSNQ